MKIGPTKQKKIFRSKTWTIFVLCLFVQEHFFTCLCKARGWARVPHRILEGGPRPRLPDSFGGLGWGGVGWGGVGWGGVGWGGVGWGGVGRGGGGVGVGWGGWGGVGWGALWEVPGRALGGFWGEAPGEVLQ